MRPGPYTVLHLPGIMLHEAKEDLPDGIYIRFRTDGSLFNVQRLLARTKTIEELSTELLFADDCVLLVNTEEAIQHIVNRFSDAAKNFGFFISLKKTEVLHQTPSREAYTPHHISIHGTNLNTMEHFTYLGSVISSDATANKDLDNRLFKASSSFRRLSKRVWQSLAPPLHKDPNIQSRCRPHRPVRCTDLCSLPEADQTT